MDPFQVLDIKNLGRLDYRAAYALQEQALARVLERRESGASSSSLGELLFVEHDPVVTVSNRPGAAAHLLATATELQAAGVAVEPTDRGGDITYHGPGQIVAYPIVDLNKAGLRLHDYLRVLEAAVIETCAEFGITAQRDAAATGVWVQTPGGLAKVCAMGIRVRQWISMHGLALNVEPDLSHFGLIVPCGLPRPVTSMRLLLGEACPPMSAVREVLARCIMAQLAAHAAARLSRQAGSA